MKMIYLTNQQHEALKLLVDRGLQDLRLYLDETSDPRMEGYSDEEVADLRQLANEDGYEIQKAIAGLLPPPGYKVLADGIFEPFYAILDDDFGTIVSGTFPTREQAVAATWKYHRGE